MKKLKKVININYLFFLLFPLILNANEDETNANKVAKSKWTDYMNEFTPAVSNPQFLVIKKSTFDEFVEILNKNELKNKSNIDSLEVKLGETQQKIKSLTNQSTEINKETIIKSSNFNQSNYYIEFVVSCILLGSIVFVLTYLWYKNKQQVKIHEESIQNIEEDFLRYKRSTLEREKKMTREIIELRKVLNPEE
jgi:hypothetical protein